MLPWIKRDKRETGSRNTQPIPQIRLSPALRKICREQNKRDSPSALLRLLLDIHKVRCYQKSHQEDFELKELIELDNLDNKIRTELHFTDQTIDQAPGKLKDILIAVGNIIAYMDDRPILFDVPCYVIINGLEDKLLRQVEETNKPTTSLHQVG